MYVGSYLKFGTLGLLLNIVNMDLMVMNLGIDIHIRLNRLLVILNMSLGIVLEKTLAMNVFYYL